MIFILVISPINVAVFAEGADAEAENEMISVSSDWKGSVFGNNGGQGNYTYENFEITEHDNDIVTVRSSNDKGKMESGTEGIAYYFKDVPTNENFELKATAHVDAWTANNQVSFGLMLRGNVLENENVGTFTGDYIAVGALDQKMMGFHKYAESSIQKEGFEFNAIAPAAEQEYDLSIQKSGNLYILKINDEIQTLESYEGEINFAGLFTSRNTTVTFSDVHLDIDDGKVELGDWGFSAFGSNTSTDRNPNPTLNDDESVTLFASGGKVASSNEGISFYYKEVPADANFEINTKAAVNSFNSDSNISTPNQKSFGLMIRDEIGEHGDSSTQTADYVAVGALDTVMKGFYKQGESQLKLEPFQQITLPAAGEEYGLTIRKSGNTFVVTANGQSETMTVENLFEDQVYVGFYVARDAEVTVSDFDIDVDAKKVTGLVADESDMKTNYLKGESLDVTGLVVYQ